MTSVDPFTKASATYREATRLPYRSGEAFQAFPPRAPRIGYGLQVAGFLLAQLASFALVALVLYALFSGMREVWHAFAR